MKKIIVVGGGTAGISVAARLKNDNKNVQIDLFEPSDVHYYQPLWTLVGAGVDKKEKTKRNTADYIPAGVNWLRRKVISFQPEERQLTCDQGDVHDYDYLVVAPGIQIDWHLIDGLTDTLGKNGVCSIYGYQEAEDTYKMLQNFKGGEAVFTAGSTPVKCGGASQKIMYLADAYFRKKKIRDKTHVLFASAGTKLFGVPGYAEALQKVVDEKEIETRFFHELIGVDGPNREARFKVKRFDQGEQTHIEEVNLPFDLLHVVPPQSAPDFIKNSPLSIQEGKSKGWLEVDPYTLQHKRFDNVFGLGDVCGIPTAKTGAAVRKQAPMVANNIKRQLNGQGPDGQNTYDGYSACPILTDYKHVVLAEFGYGNEPKSSFFFDTRKPLWSMYLLKHYLLPWLYWNRMLKGKA